jgi:plasmid stability protein
MAQLVVRNIEERVKARLKQRAVRRGHSMEAEIRDILRHAAGTEKSAKTGLGTRIARRFAGKGLNFEVPEWRGEEARPAKFRK